MAGGLELAIWCDLRVVEEDAVFGVFCRRWGVPLIDGGTIRLPRLIGSSRALDMILTGRPVKADEALAMGLANRLVPTGQSRSAAERLAREIAAMPQECMYANSRWALFHPDFDAPIPWYFRLLGLFTPEVKRRSDDIVDHLTRGSTLLHNNGDGTFTDVSDAAGVRDAQWGWGAEFLDYDDDGLPDIFSENGFVTGEIPDDI